MPELDESQKAFRKLNHTFWAVLAFVASTYAPRGQSRERTAAATESRENAATLPALLSFVVHVVVGTSLFLLVLVPVVLLQALLSTVTVAPLLANGLRVAQYALLATDTFLFLSLL